MKLAVEFSLKEPEFPLDFRRTMLSFLKKCLTDANQGKFMDKYYEAGQEKDFTFSVFFVRPDFQRDRILLKQASGKLLFSCAEKFTGFLFFSAFWNNRKNRFPWNTGTI